MKYLPFLCLPVLLFSACYEDRVACLDPDAANYDVRSDEACFDCCTYPAFNVVFERVWGEEVFSADSIYTDGADNEFRIRRLRFYLGDLQLSAGDRALPTPENILEVDQVLSGDTVATMVNDNNALVTTTDGQRSVGSYRGGNLAITALSATLGLPSILGALVPSSAPASSPLSTQPGLLYDREGSRGYVQASLEYQFVGDTVVNRRDVYGVQPFTLSFPDAEPALRGGPIFVIIRVNYQSAFAPVDLRENPEGFVDSLVAGLSITGVR